MLHLVLPEIIHTDRLLIQQLRYEDAEEIFYVYASKPEATKYVSWPTHQSVKDTRIFLEDAIKSWREGSAYSFSIRLKATGLLIGSFGIVNDHGKNSFGYVFGPNHWSQGYATEACSAIMEKLKLNKGIFRIWTLVDTDNIASSRVLLKCGFIEEARLYKWHRFVNQDNQPKDCFFYRLP